VNRSLAPTLLDEQAMLVDASVRMMEAQAPIAALRAAADGASLDDETYRALGSRLGWFGLLAEEAEGGGAASTNGLLDAVLIAYERGARLQPGPFVGHCVVVDALAHASSKVNSGAWNALLSGETWASWAFGSEDTCFLEVAGEELLLRGTSGPVADGAACGWLLLTATTDRGIAVVLVSTDSPRIGRRPLEGLDVTRRWCEFDLDEVPVASTDLLAAPGPETDRFIARQTQVAAILNAAESVGAMHADFELALQYSKDRIAFGRPIGSFQAIKHLLADTSLWLEMAKGLVHSAAHAFGTGADDGPALAHAAKAFVAERGIELAHNCFQVFGGIGYTWEHDQQLYFRRLTSDAESFGSAGWHRARLAALEMEAR
jgi:alkylation response protein AidB-like acyl-CoA dehydrogenase